MDSHSNANGTFVMQVTLPSPVKSESKSYGDVRGLSLKQLDGTIIKVSCWREASQLRVSVGDEVEAWDGRVSRFMGKATVNINIKADTLYIVCMYMLCICLLK